MIQTPLKTHIVGVNWVDRFLDHNSGFKKIYIRYQERARAAATNDIELQADFLRKLANLVHRKKISPNNLWNCDEKGITMGRNSIHTIAIVQAGGQAIAITEGSYKFCSVLETIGASGVVIPPFIVWQGKTHWKSYYREGGIDHAHEATFAVSPSSYMDDELGLEYLKAHFEPYTHPNTDSLRCLIVDGHSSHIAWRVVKYALNHNIHIICLPSKSTHLLQPLNVGCFGVLQCIYEKNLSIWLRNNPLSVKSKVAFLEILQKTRKEVYTVDLVVSAWRTAHYWPLNRNLSRPKTLPQKVGIDNIRVLDTPARIRELSREVENIIRMKLDHEETGMVHELINLIIEKVTKH